MSSVQFTAIIRLPFARGSFEDPPQAQWDAEKDRQLWKVISKSSKTSDLNWVELAGKFQVPPTFLLQQAAWLYERHLDHVRIQMKKVSGSTVPNHSTSGASTLTAVGGIAMQRTGSAGSRAPRTTSALSGGKQKDSSSLRSGEAAAQAPTLSRTPSTNTITQSRANTQQQPAKTLSTRSQRPNLSGPRQIERRRSSNTAAPAIFPVQNPPESPIASGSSSSSSSSLSDTDHPAHRSQLFKRPPRFKSQPPRGLSTFDEGDGTQEGEGSGSHGSPALPFASAAKRPIGFKYAQDTLFQTSGKPEQKALADRTRMAPSTRQKSIDQQSQATTETASSMTSSASASDAPASKAATKSPMSPASNHRADLAKLGSPRERALKKEGSEGTPSMGSSFSDIDDAGISQSALEEALLSNMQHGRMSTLSRMSRYL